MPGKDFPGSWAVTGGSESLQPVTSFGQLPADGQGSQSSYDDWERERESSQANNVRWAAAAAAAAAAKAIDRGSKRRLARTPSGQAGPLISLAEVEVMEPVHMYFSCWQWAP